MIFSYDHVLKTYISVEGFLMSLIVQLSKDLVCVKFLSTGAL